MVGSSVPPRAALPVLPRGAEERPPRGGMTVQNVPVIETSPNIPRKILALAAITEVGTGLVLIADPAIVVTLLLGEGVSGVGILLGRFFGIALLALGLACWPSLQRAENGMQAFRAMLIYNVLVASYLAYLGTVGHLRGSLLWPGVGLHAVVAVLLVWTWGTPDRTGRRQEGRNK
jgi:hypothetical protein